MRLGCTYPDCPAMFDPSIMHWAFPGDRVPVNVPGHKHSYGNPNVIFAGEEKGDYGNVDAILFTRAVIQGTDVAYPWRDEGVMPFVVAKARSEEALENGAEAFYFALPGQLVSGTPVDTRLR